MIYIHSTYSTMHKSGVQLGEFCQMYMPTKQFPARPRLVEGHSQGHAWEAGRIRALLQLGYLFSCLPFQGLCDSESPSPSVRLGKGEAEALTVEGREDSGAHHSSLPSFHLVRHLHWAVGACQVQGIGR